MAPSLSDRLAGVAQQWLPPMQAQQLPPLTLPEVVDKASYRPSMDRKSWKVLGAIAVFTLVVMGWFWFNGQPQQFTSIAYAPTSTSPANPLSSSLPASESSNAPLSTTGLVVVHVAGAVKKPGLQRLPAGSRVAEAIKAAGGVTNSKVQDSVNLARLLIDGEQIMVGAPVGAASGLRGGQIGGKVSLNSANQQELETLPGVGPSLAQRIMEFRTLHGGFRSVDELDDIAGIGSATLSRLRPLVSM
jgi:competence protein ComEA